MSIRTRYHDNGDGGRSGAGAFAKKMIPLDEKPKRKQVPIEPGFAITAHKAQGQTMGKVVVDLAGCAGTEQPYVMVSRSSSLEGLVILRDFDYGKVTRRHSEDLRKELKRLECLRLQTIVKIGSDSKGFPGQKYTNCMTIYKFGRFY